MTESPLPSPDQVPPARWLAASVQLPPPGEVHLLVEALRRLGGQGIERTPAGSRIRAYFPRPADPPALAHRLTAAIRSATSLDDPAPTWAAVSEEELRELWEAELEPRTISPGITILPEGSPSMPDRPGIVIRMKPGPAFGQGRHPTTQLGLRLLENIVEEASLVLDLGAGSGILAIAAALLGAQQVEAVEGNVQAASHAQDNIVANHLQNRVQVRTQWATPTTLQQMGPYDGAVANLEPPVLIPLLPSLVRCVRPGGWIVVTGVPGGDVVQLRDEFDALPLRLEAEDQLQGWWAGRLLRTC